MRLRNGWGTEGCWSINFVKSKDNGNRRSIDSTGCMKPHPVLLRKTVSCWEVELQLGGAAAASADEIDGGAEFEERVGGGFDSIDAGDGVEDYVLLLGGGV